jgi:hypothetical protein
MRDARSDGPSGAVMTKPPRAAQRHTGGPESPCLGTRLLHQRPIPAPRDRSHPERSVRRARSRRISCLPKSVVRAQEILRLRCFAPALRMTRVLGAGIERQALERARPPSQRDHRARQQSVHHPQPGFRVFPGVPRVSGAPSPHPHDAVRGVAAAPGFPARMLQGRGSRVVSCGQVRPARERRWTTTSGGC